MPLRLPYHETSQSSWTARARAVVQVVVLQYAAAADLRLQCRVGEAEGKQCCLCRIFQHAETIQVRVGNTSRHCSNKTNLQLQVPSWIAIVT